MRRTWRRSGLRVITAVLLTAGACSGDDETTDGTAQPAPSSPADEVSPATFEVRESVEQLAVTGADAGEELVLFADEVEVDRATTDDQGSLVFRLVEPGDGYVIQEADGDRPESSEELVVMTEEGSLPDQSFYDGQELQAGFGYIETRDGTLLSVDVTLPGPVEDGPYPTVVEYSGYDPSKPGTNLVAGAEEDGELPVDREVLCGELPVLCDAPSQPGSILASLAGYAVVGVNMRGTGCSGGAYDFFETMQVLDGYDVIETVAAQDWVANGRVGMVGLSYPGLAQLWVAAARPPSLAAITPLSVLADTVRSTLAPGGIYNEGFAFQWVENVLEEAVPYGQGWEQDLVDAGDETCEANQLLRGQNVDGVAKAKEHPYYEPEIADPLNPSLFVDRIDVPVFMSGSAQDEQTGPHFPILFDRFANAPVHKFTLVNGAHPDSFAPQILIEWKTFLDFYVREEIEPLNPLVRVLAPIIFESIFGTQIPLPPERFAEAASFDEARAQYEAEPDVRVLFESGAGADPGLPVARFEASFTEWPVAGLTPTTWYFQADGSLSTTAPTEADDSASQFVTDPGKGSERTMESSVLSDVYVALPPYQWAPPDPGEATVFVSDPLADDLVMLGGASADLWIRSSQDDADLSVVLSEVRPDGQETFIQEGVLRASRRGLDEEASSPLRPVQSLLEVDEEPLPDGEWALARMEIFTFNHIFRAGSRIRISVETPGGNRPLWSYVLDEHPEPPVVAVSHSAQHPSAIVLPVVGGISGYPADLPPCPSLRGQPCRDWVPYENTPAVLDD